MYKIKHMGRLPPYKDPRIYSPEKALKALNHEETKEFVSLRKNLATEHFNTESLPPVYDQGNLGSCVAFSTISMMEYLTKLVHKQTRNYSQLYTYKMGRDYAFGTAEEHGDTGLWLKDGIATIVKHGLVGAERYPYDIEKYDWYPPAHLHAYADDYSAVTYFRLDYPNVSMDKRLERINTYLSNKWPVIAGFYVFDSADMGELGEGTFPYPSENEGMLGGHAVMLYGYDNNKVITNPISGEETVGAWKFRNSWGEIWGDMGDGWLPFDYLTKPIAEEFILADEFYTVTRMKWLDLWDFE